MTIVRKTHLLKILLAAIAIMGMTAERVWAQRNKIELNPAGIPLAAPDSAVDQVAYSYQKRAIAKLKVLLKRREGTATEPVFLIRLARLQQENADITFRIAHTEAFYAKKPIALTQYKRAMNESIETLNRLIKNYPTYPELPTAYFLRSKGYEEIGNTAAAKEGYLFLAKNYPSFAEINKVYISLADFAERDADYALAIEFLKTVVQKKDSSEYPFALFKTAWAYYYLKDVDRAFSYLRTYLSFYDTRIAAAKSNEKAIGADSLVRDDMLQDSTMFYLRGFELKDPKYAIAKALAYFRELASGPNADGAYAKMLFKFARLLRVNNHEEALAEWKDIVVASESKRAETLDVVLVTFEDQLNRYRYKPLLQTITDVVNLSKASKARFSFEKAEKLLLESATRVQKQFVANQGRNTGVSLSIILVGIYNAFLSIVDPADPRAFLAHYNLAEAFAGVKKYDAAIRHYQWVVDHRNSDAAPAPGTDAPKAPHASAKKLPVPIVEVALKIVVLHYEGLKEKNAIPTELKPGEIKAEPQAPDPAVTRWIQSIDQAEALAAAGPKPKGLDLYHFEASRTLYSQGFVATAVQRLAAFDKEYPGSEFSEPAATLLLDTLIASKRWSAVNRYSVGYLKKQGWRKEYVKRLYDVAADSFYKMTEEFYNQSKHASVLANAEYFERDYASSPRKEDYLNIFARSALTTGQRGRAIGYLSRLIKDSPKSKYFGDALLLRAQEYEKGYVFDAAAKDYRRYLGLGLLTKVEDLRGLREKILLLTWLSGAHAEQLTAISSPEICGQGGAETCDRYHALALLDSASDSKSKSPIALAQKRYTEASSAANRALWALIALEAGSRLSLDQRFSLLRAVESGAKSWEPLTAFAVLPALLDRTVKAYAEMRVEVAKGVPLKADKDVIAKRVALIQKIEKSAMETVRLPWAKIQAGVLNLVSDLYADLASGIQELPAPKELGAEEVQVYRDTMAQIAGPFHENAKQLRAKAFKTASDAGIEDSAFQAVAMAYFKDHPEESKALLPDGQFPQPKEIDTSIIVKIDPKGGWELGAAPNGALDDQIDGIWKYHWIKGLKDKRWPLVAFVTQRAQAEASLRAENVGLMKAISLAAVGARAEALAVLDDTRKEADGNRKVFLTVTLIRHYSNTLSRDRVRTLLEGLDDEQIRRSFDREETPIVARLSGRAI